MVALVIPWGIAALMFWFGVNVHGTFMAGAGFSSLFLLIATKVTIRFFMGRGISQTPIEPQETVQMAANLNQPPERARRR